MLKASLNGAGGFWREGKAFYQKSEDPPPPAGNGEGFCSVSTALESRKKTLFCQIASHVLYQ